MPQGSDSLVAALRVLAASPDGWTGTASELLGRLTAQDPAVLEPLGAAVTPEVLGAHLRPLAPVLQTGGVLVTFTREGRAGRRVIRLGMAPPAPVGANGDGPEDRPSAPLADADSPPGPLLAAPPPVAAAVDRYARRLEIRRTLWQSELYGIAIRDHPAAAERVVDQLLALLPAPVTEALGTPR